MTMRRVLLTTHSCYLDDSNGAAVASRALMQTLERRGFAVEVLSGTMLDLAQDVDLAAWLGVRGFSFQSYGGTSWSVDASGIRPEQPRHYRLNARGVPVTLHHGATTRPHAPDSVERAEFLHLFEAVLDRFRPDVLINYGGDLLAHEIRSRARARGVSIVFPLHNFHYSIIDTFLTVDAVIVPSQFAADYYRKSLGLKCTVLSNLIDFSRVQAANREPKYLTFVTPSFEKGVYAFARIADELCRRRSDIPLLVVEGRGTERTLVDCGLDLRGHGNVYLMDHTSDPRRFWAVTKVGLMPSLWMENQPLVAVEAMINGVPVIASDRGALPETLGSAGIVLPLPDRLTQFTRELPASREAASWVEAVIRLWDDADWYTEQNRRALTEARRWSPEVLEPLYVEFFENVGSGQGRRG